MFSKLYGVLYTEIFSYISLDEILKYREISKTIRDNNQILFVNILNKARVIVCLDTYYKKNEYEEYDDKRIFQNVIYDTYFPYKYRIYSDEEIFVFIWLDYLNYFDEYQISGELEESNIEDENSISHDNLDIEYGETNYSDKLELYYEDTIIKGVNNILDVLPERHRILYHIIYLKN